MSGIDDLIASLSGVQDSFKEGFEVFKKFLLNVELASLSFTFMLLTLVLWGFILLLFSSPALVLNVWDKQKKAIKKFMDDNKNPRDWIGKS